MNDGNTHDVTPVRQLKLTPRPGRSPAIQVTTGKYSARIIFFEAGQIIATHSHDTGPLYKFVLEGAIEYDDHRQLLLPGDIAKVDKDIQYKGQALRDTYLLLLEPVP